MDQAEIIEANTAEDYAIGRYLIEEYAAALGVDLCLQNFAQEIANLPKMYGPPHGCLLLASADEEAVGCVAIRKQSDTTCEMKRLYVKPKYRGADIGRRLAEIAILNAQQLGYARMVLDTLPSVVAAQSLYGSLGFRENENYYQNLKNSVRYLELELN